MTPRDRALRVLAGAPWLSWAAPSARDRLADAIAVEIAQAVDQERLTGGRRRVPPEGTPTRAAWDAYEAHAARCIVCRRGGAHWVRMLGPRCADGQRLFDAWLAL